MVKQRTCVNGGALALALVMLAGCPKTKPQPDAGVPDACNDKNEALTSPDCVLTLDNTPKLGFISYNGDEDWFRMEMPATLTARSLLHVRAGYGAPNTAVNLSLNVLRDDGAHSLGNGVDSHGQGAPKPVDLVFRFTEPNAKLLALLSDGHLNSPVPIYDVNSQYSVQAEVLTDPDPNEPNDNTPTAVNLSPAGAYVEGQQTGYLSTTDDVDRFTFTVTPSTSGKRRIAYVHLTTQLPPFPPPPYRISFTLLDKSGTPLVEKHAQFNFQAADLATAWLVQPDTYQVVVQAYHSPNTPGPVPGDLRQQYTLDVRVMDETDSHEPNDAASTTVNVTLGAVDGPPSSVSGRLEHQGDQDFFSFGIPANPNPSVIHYQLTWGTNPAARFPSLPGALDRQVRFFTFPSSIPACKTDLTVCPRGDEGDPGLIALVNKFCDQSLCLRSERDESLVFPNLKNFEGTLPIPPHAGTMVLVAYVGDDQNDWADDSDYTLQLQWKSDPDEASRYSGGVEQVTVLPMTVDVPTSASFPAPPAGATTLSGTLSHGYGRLYNFIPANGDGVRGPEDYDAVPSDVDRYEIDLPPQDPAAGPLDRTWELQWKVDHTADGGYAHDLGLDIMFCDGDMLDGGSCTPVGSAPYQPQTLVYTGDSLASWHNASGGALQPVYDRAVTPASETVTARAYGCYCFEPRYTKGGKLFVNVTAVDRSRYDEVPYAVRMAITSYPKAYPLPNDAGTKLCPPPTLPDAGSDGGTSDGGYLPGCRFTQQP